MALTPDDIAFDPFPLRLAVFPSIGVEVEFLSDVLELQDEFCTLLAIYSLKLLANAHSLGVGG
jgi:hypothetical protein